MLTFKLQGSFWAGTSTTTIMAELRQRNRDNTEELLEILKQLC